MGGVRFLISALISKQISDFWMQISADFNWFHHSVYEISTVASPSVTFTHMHTNTHHCHIHTHAHILYTTGL